MNAARSEFRTVARWDGATAAARPPDPVGRVVAAARATEPLWTDGSAAASFGGPDDDSGRETGHGRPRAATSRYLGHLQARADESRKTPVPGDYGAFSPRTCPSEGHPRTVPEVKRAGGDAKRTIKNAVRYLCDVVGRCVSVTSEVRCVQSHRRGVTTTTTTSNAAHTLRADGRGREGGGGGGGGGSGGGGGGVSSLSCCGGAPYITGPRPKSAICTGVDIRRRRPLWLSGNDGDSGATKETTAVWTAADGSGWSRWTAPQERPRVLDSRGGHGRTVVGFGRPRTGTRRIGRARGHTVHGSSAPGEARRLAKPNDMFSLTDCPLSISFFSPVRKPM